MTTYYDRFLHLGVQATCPGCGTTLRLHEFRKWWGKRRILRTLCKACEPEKALEDMTPDERLHALDNQRPFATPVRIARLNAEDAAAKVARARARGEKNATSRRIRAWAPLLKALNQERAWAIKNQITPHSPAWATFFESYEAALSDAIRRATQTRNQTRSITLNATQAEPTRWLYPETMRSLLRLYGQCVPPPGRKSYRDPAFLEWGGPTPFAPASVPTSV